MATREILFLLDMLGVMDGKREVQRNVFLCFFSFAESLIFFFNGGKVEVVTVISRLELHGIYYFGDGEARWCACMIFLEIYSL